MPSKKMMSKQNTQWVKDLIRDEMDQELEDKVAVIGATAVGAATPDIPSGATAATSDNFIQLLPQIDQAGTINPATSLPYPSGQYNIRTGNEISLKHLDISLLLSIKTPQNQLAQNTSLGVRVMILRQKDTNDYIQFAQNAQTDKLLENGLIATAGPSNFRGDTFNLFQKINREQFAVRYDKTFYLDPTNVITGTGSNVYAVKTQKPTFIRHRLKFGKTGLKLTFSEGASDVPTNFPYIMVIGYASTSTTARPDASRILYSYTANASYQDA